MQAADIRPDPTFQRKAAIAAGAALDHAGRVRVTPVRDFDLDRTIFKTLAGRAQRLAKIAEIGKEVTWHDADAVAIQKAYEALVAEAELPPIDPDLLAFMVEACDFDVEHADGSFLDHLYFCFEYTVHHYPGHSALVMLLHSILGTGTNTFAMPASRMPDLQALLPDADWQHIAAFPSVLRLVHDQALREELRANLGRLDRLQSVRFHRVIDNAPMEMDAETFWEALNFQLIHLVDFLPVANWQAHANDTSFLVFRSLHALLRDAGRLDAAVDYAPPSGPATWTGETRTPVGWIASHLPADLTERLLSRSIRRFSADVGHDMSYAISWTA